MEIKPVIQNKKLAYPLAAAAVVGAVALSGCQQLQQQQIYAGAPPQMLGGVVVPTKGEPPIKAEHK